MIQIKTTLITNLSSVLIVQKVHSHTQVISAKIIRTDGYFYCTNMAPEHLRV